MGDIIPKGFFAGDSPLLKDNLGELLYCKLLRYDTSDTPEVKSGISDFFF